MHSSDRTFSNTEPPPVIADLTMVRQIAQGTYGEVWLARTVSDALRAVKVVRRSRFEQERSFERAFEGIQRFAPISRLHPGFVQILQVGRDDADGYYYSVMERADADAEAGRGDLASYRPHTLATSRQRLPIDRTIDVGVSLAASLQCLHDNGLSHRDIKPTNIVFVSGQPKLADIGVVAGTGQSSVPGPDGYVPPEGPGAPEADVFSLGMVLYELATGMDRLDFPTLPDGWSLAGDRAERASRHALNQLLGKACAPDTTKRFCSASELLGALEGLKNSEAVKRRRRTRVIGFGSALLLMACLLGLGVAEFTRKDAPGVQGTSAEDDLSALPLEPIAGVDWPPESPPPALALSGGVKITSSPPGARVMQGDKEIGKTPLYLSESPVGQVELSIEMTGFHREVVTGTVAIDEILILDAQLREQLPPDTGQP